MPVQAEQQNPVVGKYVELYDLDFTSLGGNLIRWTPGNPGTPTIKWRGNDYIPFPISATGFEYSGKGTLPKPKLRVANIGGVATTLCLQYQDGIGAVFTRWRTLARFLDAAPTADPNAYWPIDVFVIDRKSQAEAAFVDWEMAAAIDQQGKRLPGRQVVRDVCTHTYRRWTGTAFDYTGVTCPFTGTSNFDTNDQPCAKSSDRCSRRLTGCTLRFPDPLAKPTRAFPGVARVRFPS